MGIDRVIGCAAAGALLLAGCRGAERSRDGVRWSTPTPVSQTTGGGAAPTLAVAPSGRLTLAWVAAPDAGIDGRLTLRPDAHAAAAHQLVDPAGSLSIYGEVPPKIAYAPDGTLYAAYLLTKAVPGHRWPTHTLRVAASADGGAHWGEPRTVSSDSAFGGSTDDHALHVAADGTLYLTWLARSRDTSHTYLARSSDQGVTWSAPRAIDDGASCPCCRTALASGPDGTLYVGWRRIFPGAAGETEVRDIVVARSTDGGRTWSAPVRVHEDGWRVRYCPDAGPTLKVGADGAVHVAWWTGKEGEAGVKYARSDDGGRSFGAPVPLGVASASKAAHAQLALGDAAHPGLVLAVWDDGTRKLTPVVARVSRDGGRAFGPTEQLSEMGRSAGYPTVALHGDTVTAVWQERGAPAAQRDSAAQAAVHQAMHSGGRHDAAQLIKPVGAWQVVARSGVLARPAAARARDDGRFRPVAVGDAAPAYAARIISASPTAGDSIRIGASQPLTLLNVWATWCTSCREEMADLNALEREYGPRGLRVVGVSVDQGDAAKVARFAAKERLAFTVAHDPEGRVQESFQVVGVPSTYLIDARGTIRWTHVGTLGDVMPRVRAAVDSAMGRRGTP